MGDKREPWGYWVKHKYAEGGLVREPCFVPEESHYTEVLPLYTRPSEQAVTEAAGSWREVETNSRLKGRRRNPVYFPAIGEECEVSGPNCDDANGYTWVETTILWQNEIFILYGSNGYWPILHKHEHVLFRPTALRAAMDTRRDSHSSA